MNGLATQSLGERGGQAGSVPKIVFETDLKIFDHILFAVDNENMILDVEEFLKEPLHRIEGL